MDNLSFQNQLEVLLEKEYNEKVQILITKRFGSLDEVTEVQGAIREIKEVGEMCKRVSKELYGERG